MADPVGPLLDPDDKDAALFSVKEEAPQSPPLLSYSPSLLPHEFLFFTPPTSASPPSPPLGHSATLAEKAGAESLFMPWLSGGSLLDAEDAADDCKGEERHPGGGGGRKVSMLTALRQYRVNRRKMIVIKNQFIE